MIGAQDQCICYCHLKHKPFVVFSRLKSYMIVASQLVILIDPSIYLLYCTTDIGAATFIRLPSFCFLVTDIFAMGSLFDAATTTGLLSYHTLTVKFPPFSEALLRHSLKPIRTSFSVDTHHTAAIDTQLSIFNYSVYCKTARRCPLPWSIGAITPSNATFRVLLRRTWPRECRSRTEN